MGASLLTVLVAILCIGAVTTYPNRVRKQYL
jgi:hypothetical protein